MRFATLTPRRLKIDIAVLSAVFIIGGLAVLNARAVGDWVFFVHYRPPAAIQQLASAAGMNDQGKHLLYRFQPLLVSNAQMQQHCGPRLGCTDGTHIYILQASDQNYDRSIVTASHEMLHVAYSRLGGQDKQYVDAMIKHEITSGPGKSVAYELDGYDAKDKINEAHSYLGSEAPKLSPELEKYYERYFVRRAETTRAFLASPEGAGVSVQ